MVIYESQNNWFTTQCYIVQNIKNRVWETRSNKSVTSTHTAAEGSAIKNYTPNFHLVLNMKKIPKCNQYAYHWEYYKSLTTTSWTMAQKEKSLCICSVSNIWRSVQTYNSEDIGITCVLDTVSCGLKEFLFMYNVATYNERIKIMLISR
jgi:hypothetical protein